MKRFTVLLLACSLLALLGMQPARGQTRNGNDPNSSGQREVNFSEKSLVPTCSEFIDQSNYGTNVSYIGVSGLNNVAQSFTAGSKGRLVSIDIDFQVNSCPMTGIFQFTAELLAGNGWGGPVLASQVVTIYLPFTRALLPIDFSSPATVYTGENYTLRIRPDIGQICDINMGTQQEVTGMWFGSETNSYNGGETYINGVPEINQDAYFATTISPNSSYTMDITACRSYFWSASGLTYFLTGVHEALYTNSAGCDSIVTLNLTINNVDASAELPDPYSLHAITSGASYQWLNCADNYSPIGGATGQDFFPDINGQFAVEVTFNGCTDTSECLTITAFGIPDNEFGNAIQVFPNPTTGAVTLEIGSAIDQLKVEVHNALGQMVSSQQLSTSGTLTIETGVSPGIYLIRLSSPDGRTANIRVLRE